MSGESAQDIEVSITAPNRSFHATVIASDVSWQDRPAGAGDADQQPRRPIWSSAFGNSIDSIDSESIDPMVNSATSLSQDSYDGFAVEFVSSKETAYMNGGVASGVTQEAAAPPAALEAAAAAFTAPTCASDAISTAIEMRPVGFSETDRGSISCEMITPKPVLIANGHVSSGESQLTSTVSASSTNATGTETTVTSSTTVTDTKVTASSTSEATNDSAVTTHEPMAPGSTFQMTPMESHEEHAEAPERARDRAMSLHERSLLAHDMHALASTMDTIKDEGEENHVGSSINEEKRTEETYTSDRRVSLTGVPISATTYVAPSQPTIFEVAETAAAAVAAAAEAAAPGAEGAAPAADEPSPYLKKLLDAQEATRQLMALLGESTQMLGTLPTNKPEDKEQQAADAASAATATSAVAETASSIAFTSQSSSSMTSSSAFSSSTTAADSSAPAAPAATSADTAPTVTTSAPEAASATDSLGDVAAASPAATASDLAPPQTPTTPASPALEISSRPIDITFDDGSVVQPAEAAAESTEIPVTVPPQPEQDAAAAPTAAAASTEIPVTVWKQPEESAATPTSTPAATEIPVTVGQQPAFGTAAAAPVAPSEEGTQNASICSALETLAANMTTVTTTNAEPSSSSTVTTTAPVTLGTPVQLQPPASPTTSMSEPAPTTDGTVSPTPASMLHESTMSSLSVGIPTPCPTPEPDQERFVRNNEQSEATITKSSFTFESSTNASSTEAGAASTDYVLPTTTSIVLTADDATATAPAPTVTPAAVDVPVEIVRHLDDAAAWHSAPAAESDASATAVPIAVVPATSGPPPLAREPPVEREVEVPASPKGPPPLARESEEHHELSRSVMVERRVLTPDSGAPQHHESTAEAAQTASAVMQQSSSSSSTQVNSSSVIKDSTADSAQQTTAPAASTEIPVSVWKQPEQAPAADAAPTSTPAAPTAEPAAPAPASAADEAPLSVVLQPSLSQQEKEAEAAKDALIDIPVTVVQQEPSVDSAKDAAGVPAAEAAEQKSDSVTATADETASVPIPVSIVQEESSPATEPTAATNTEIPVTVWKQPEQESTAASSEIPVTVVQEPVLACELTKQPEPADSTEIPVTVSQQPDQEKIEPNVTAAATEIPVIVQQQPEQSAADATQQTPDESARTTTPEVPVANAAQQEQQQTAAPAPDATATSPTTAHAPMSLESTFQITPSDEDVAHPPSMTRDRAMSIHERSMLAHESSGFQSALETVPENENGEVHVASCADTTARRASLAPGADGEAPTSTFQLPSTSCLFTVDEAPKEESEATAPAETASPSNESASSTTIASSIVDVTAPAEAEAAKSQPSSGGVQWLTESEPAHEEHSKTPESPQTVVAAAPATLQQQDTVTSTTPAAPASDAAAAAQVIPAATPAVDVTSPEVVLTSTPAADVPQTGTVDAMSAAAPSADVSQNAAPEVAAPSAEVPPPTPKTPSEVSWTTVPATITMEPTSAATELSATTTEAAQPLSESQAPPQTPKTPQGVSWITEPSQDASAAPAAPAAEPIIQLQPAPQSVQPESKATVASPAAPEVAPASADVPQTPKSPSDGVTWISEPATATTTAPSQSTAESQAPPQTPKTPTGVTWISEPAAPAADGTTEQPPATPKSPSGVSWITEPAQPATSESQAPPQTPKTPTGVSWITEPAAPVATSGVPDGPSAPAPVATPTSPSVINITAPPEGRDNGAGAPPLTPTSPGIKWASDSTRIGGNVEAAGGAPAPDESTFVVNAPWEGAEPPAPAAPSASDADGVTWITETPAEAAATPKEPEITPRPPLTRSESTRSERDPSTATDVTVREATPQRKTLAPSAGGEEENLTNGVTQEGQGTKVRKLSWADQQPSGTEDSFSAAIDDYEKKLNETTAQTRELVDLLCQTGSQITENSMKMSDVFSDAVQAGVRSMLDQERRDRAAATLSPIAENGEPMSREPPPQLIAGALPPNVDSVIVSCPELKYVTGSLVLENANILVTDEESGLFLFTLDSKVVRHITNPSWKRASSPAIFKDRLKSYIIILMDCKDEEDGSWVRHIVKFTENLDYIEKVECPKWIREKTIISDRLAVNRYENIYYCANGELFSGLYELAPTGKWTELLFRQSESFIDMLAFAIIGPIQQILIVEGRRDHVLLCSIRESVCVDARRMALCERPGALAKDESGRLFVMNRAQAAVQIVDTRVWAACRNMALVDKFVPHFSASFGMLVIPQKRAVKVHKYSFEWDD